MQRPQPTTAVVAPSAGLRERVANALAREGIQVCVRAAAIADLEAGSSNAPPDVLILAFEEGWGARQTAGDIRRAFPGVRLVLLTGAGAHATPGLESQVEGIVPVSRLQAALPPTVRAVLAEQVVFPRNGRRRTDSPPPLSHRERQVLRLAVTGQTNAQIAARLCLSTSTVKSHLTSSFAKLGVRSRSEAAALILNPAEPVSNVVFARLRARSPSVGELRARH